MPTFLSPHSLAHPAIPPGLDALTILHLTDFHIRFPLDAARGPRHKWLDQLLADVASVTVDLVALTGDYIDSPRHEPLGLDLLDQLARIWKLTPAGAAVGIFGNHDTPSFRRSAKQQSDKTHIHWLDRQPLALAMRPSSPPLTLAGYDHPEDFLSAPSLAMQPAPLLTLIHEPTALIPAANAGLPILLAGHTHGGQVRLSPRFAPHTSSDTPHHLAAGIIRLNHTLCAISRGLGDGVIEGLRINCPRQAPLYTLRRGQMVEHKGDPPCEQPVQVVGW